MVATVVALASLAGCSSDDDLDEDGALAAELRATGLTLYLPALEGEPSGVEVDDGVVVVTYAGGDGPAQELHQQPVPRGSLCRAVPQIAGSECAEEDGVLRSTMEEMATVAVVRGDTLLVLRGLVREADPGMVEAAVALLREAPAASPEQLAAVAG